MIYEHIIVEENRSIFNPEKKILKVYSVRTKVGECLLKKTREKGQICVGKLSNVCILLVNGL